ncbi:hypothetical protein [Thioclava sp. F28-4]|uniref:hypothetical protein n=1 Tax=Thioclava sp. F28-4 TaxID=1915315 RepID=UPI000996D65A|nr:hypothetical protein [Thioclava sp. F28-4]OOY04674.1 hypothetical protein BMI87_10700 [Thioclava sp. F28-4]
MMRHAFITFFFSTVFASAASADLVEPTADDILVWFNGCVSIAQPENSQLGAIMLANCSTRAITYCRIAELKPEGAACVARLKDEFTARTRALIPFLEDQTRSSESFRRAWEDTLAQIKADPSGHEREVDCPSDTSQLECAAFKAAQAWSIGRSLRALKDWK